MKIVYKTKWFPVPVSLVGDGFFPGPLAELAAGELRLYLYILSCGRGNRLVVELDNSDVKRFAGLNDDSLPSAREGLESRKLIKPTKIGRGVTYRYEILEPKTSASVDDTWGLMPEDHETDVPASVDPIVTLEVAVIVAAGPALSLQEQIDTARAAVSACDIPASEEDDITAQIKAAQLAKDYALKAELVARRDVLQAERAQRRAKEKVRLNQLAAQLGSTIVESTNR